MTIDELAGMMAHSFQDMEAHMNKRFDLVDDRFDYIEDRMDTVENRLDSVESRLSTVETKVDAMRSDISSLVFDASKTKTRVENLEINVFGSIHTA